MNFRLKERARTRAHTRTCIHVACTCSAAFTHPYNHATRVQCCFHRPRIPRRAREASASFPQVSASATKKQSTIRRLQAGTRGRLGAPTTEEQDGCAGDPSLIPPGHLICRGKRVRGRATRTCGSGGGSGSRSTEGVGLWCRTIFADCTSTL